jgi:hypothetical protein
MAQQTAVEQLISLLQSERNELEKAGDKTISVGLYAAEFIAQQFLNIEKEQIMRANIDGYEEAQRYGETSAEDYYNETYNK